MNEQPFLISPAPPHLWVPLSSLCDALHILRSLPWHPPPPYSSCASIFIHLSLLFFLSLSDQPYSDVGAVAAHIKCYNPDAAGTSGHHVHMHMHCLQRGPDVSGCLWQRWFINAASPAPPSSLTTAIFSTDAIILIFWLWGGRGAGREHS